MTTATRPQRHHSTLESRLAAAAMVKAFTRRSDQLKELLPDDLMPDAGTLGAVYRITGATEEQRLERAAGRFPLTARTEAAWCRAQLTRWAVRSVTTVSFSHSD